MNRVQRFKEIRRFRTKLFLTILLIFSILLVGIGVVDYSISSLLNGEKGFGIFSVVHYEKEYCKISFFDKELYINTKYLERDYNRLADWLESKKQMLGLH